MLPSASHYGLIPLGFEQVTLRPGKARRVTVTADPRLLAWGIILTMLRAACAQ
jgi:hypothetical protein